MTTIIVTHEDDEVDEFEFESSHSTITIGRRSSNDVCVPDLSISGNHAQITLQGSEAWLEDLNSTNGSYVNGQVIKRTVIDNGDDIILGKIRLAFIHSPSHSTAAVEEKPRQTTATNTAAVSAAKKVAAPAAELDPITEIAGDLDDSLSESQAVSQAANADAAPAKVSSDDEMSFDEDARIFAQPPVESARSTVSAATPVMSAVASNGQQHGKNQQTPHPLDGVERHVPIVEAASDATDAPPMHELDKAPATSKGAVIEIKNGAKSGQILPIDKPVTTLGRPGIQIAAIMRKPDGYFLMHIESDDSVDRPTLNQDAIGDEPVLLHSGDELNVAGIDVEFMLS